MIAAHFSQVHHALQEIRHVSEHVLEILRGLVRSLGKKTESGHISKISIGIKEPKVAPDDFPPGCHPGCGFRVYGDPEAQREISTLFAAESEDSEAPQNEAVEQDLPF